MAHVEWEIELNYSGSGQVFDLSNLADLGMLEHDGLGMPPVTVATQSRGERDGSIYQGYRLEERVINLVMWARGQTETEYWDQRDRLLRVLRPMVPVVLRQTRTDGSQRELLCRVAGGMPMPSKSKKGWSVRDVVRLIAVDPLWTDPIRVTSVDEITVSNLSDQVSIPPFGTGYIGSADSPFVIKIKPTGNMINPMVKIIDPMLNKWSCRLVGYTIVGASHHWVEFNFDAMTIKNQDGTDLMSYLEDDGDFVMMRMFASMDGSVASTMEIQIESGSWSWTATVDFAYYTKYLGV